MLLQRKTAALTTPRLLELEMFIYTFGGAVSGHALWRCIYNMPQRIAMMICDTHVSRFCALFRWKHCSALATSFPQSAALLEKLLLGTAA